MQHQPKYDNTPPRLLSIPNFSFLSKISLAKLTSALDVEVNPANRRVEISLANPIWGSNLNFLDEV